MTKSIDVLNGKAEVPSSMLLSESFFWKWCLKDLDLWFLFLEICLFKRQYIDG